MLFLGDNSAKNRVFQGVVGGVAGSTGKKSGIFRHCGGVVIDWVGDGSRGISRDSWKVGFEFIQQ